MPCFLYCSQPLFYFVPQDSHSPACSTNASYAFLLRGGLKNCRYLRWEGGVSEYIQFWKIAKTHTTFGGYPKLFQRRFPNDWLFCVRKIKGISGILKSDYGLILASFQGQLNLVNKFSFFKWYNSADAPKLFQFNDTSKLCPCHYY